MPDSSNNNGDLDEETFRRSYPVFRSKTKAEAA
jgi:hypothetical protein